jgi:hypothetical protein
MVVVKAAMRVVRWAIPKAVVGAIKVVLKVALVLPARVFSVSRHHSLHQRLAVSTTTFRSRE